MKCMILECYERNILYLDSIGCRPEQGTFLHISIQCHRRRWRKSSTKIYCNCKFCRIGDSKPLVKLWRLQLVSSTKRPLFQGHEFLGAHARDRLDKPVEIQSSDWKLQFLNSSLHLKISLKHRVYRVYIAVWHQVHIRTENTNDEAPVFLPTAQYTAYVAEDAQGGTPVVQIQVSGF